MKKMSVLLFLGLLGAFSAFAQNNSIADRVLDKADQVMGLLESRIRSMDRNSQRAVFEELRQLESLLLNGNSNPPPPPTNDPVRRSVVRGTLESMSFSFDVVDRYDAFVKCSAFVESQRITQVDDIKVSLNFGQERVLHNSASYWKGKGQICLQVTKASGELGLELRQNQYSLAGDVEGVGFLFQGYDLAELDQQCQNYLSQNRITQADDISVSNDFMTVANLHNSAGYWRGNYDICQQIISRIH